VTISFALEAARACTLELISGLCIFTRDGRLATRQVAPSDHCTLAAGERRRYETRYDPLLLGPREYLALAVAAVRDAGAEGDGRHRIFISRPVLFEVRHPDRTEASLFIHPAAHWRFQDAEAAAQQAAAVSAAGGAMPLAPTQ
jgi:hypothetical protein